MVRPNDDTPASCSGMAAGELPNPHPLMLTHDLRIGRPAVAGVAAALPPGPADLDALREIVREIVRSELRGRLGEDATCHIRGIVRREVAAAIEDLIGS